MARINIRDTKQLAKYLDIWYKKGFRLDQVIDWLAVGVDDYSSAIVFEELDVDPDDAKEWIERGFSPEDVEDLFDIGVENPYEAKEWSDYFDIDKDYSIIAHNVDLKFTPKEAVDDYNKGFNEF